MTNPIIKYYNNNGIKVKFAELYYENDKLHRLDGPAVIWYDNDHNGIIYIALEEYLENGMRHRIGGPAVIYYDETSTIYREEVWEYDCIIIDK